MKTSTKVLLGIFGFGVVVTLMGRDDDTSKPTGPPKCSHGDWRGCKDAGELVNTYDMVHAQVDCKFKANDLAKYGTPKWPSLPFGSVYGLKDGRVTLIEPDAQFQNAFGTMVHSRVECLYDLDAKKVLNVNIAER